jgi:hypothetical protein
MSAFIENFLEYLRFVPDSWMRCFGTEGQAYQQVFGFAKSF